MNPRLSNSLVLLMAVTLSAGCIPLGPRRGQERVVATKTLTTNEISEKIIAAPTEHHWMLLVAPDGPELNYVLSETWRYYLVSPDHSRVPLGFLKHRGFTPWDRLEPVSNTNLWIAERYTGSLDRVEHGHYEFQVICFDANGVKTDKRLDFPEYGTLEFDAPTHMVTYRTKSAIWTYDPLDESGPHRVP